jgi:hypothetical protein
MLPSANPSRYQRREPSVVTTCTVLDAGTSARLVPVQCPRGRVRRPVDAMIGQPSGHRLPGRIWPDTVHSTRHAMANQKRRGQGTDERHGRHSDILDRHDHKAARRDTPSSRCGAGVCGLANQGWLGDGNTASATVTTAATGQPLGVGLPSKRRLGALLSSDDFGSSVERAAKLHPLWQGFVPIRRQTQYSCG